MLPPSWSWAFECLVFSVVYGTLEVWPWQWLVTGVRLWEIIDSGHLNSAFLYFTPLVKRQGPSASCSMDHASILPSWIFPSETVKLKQTLPSVKLPCLCVLSEQQKAANRGWRDNPRSCHGRGKLTLSLTSELLSIFPCKQLCRVWKKSIIMEGTVYAQDWVGETSWCHVDRMRSSCSWSVSHICWVWCERKWCQSEN